MLSCAFFKSTAKQAFFLIFRDLSQKSLGRDRVDVPIY